MNLISMRGREVVDCAIKMYNSNMAKAKEIPFSEARQKLSSIVDEVEKTGRPIKILRHGKVAAVVVGDVEYRAKFETRKKWKLAGSIKFRRGFNIDKTLKDISEENIRQHRLSMKRSLKEFED
jgi:prevent-host-death family protein